MSLSAPIAPQTMTSNADLEALKGRSGGNLEAEKARLKKVACEFESLFIHQMLAAMRKTVPKNELGSGALSSGMGKEVFTDMFDMELAKGIADGKPGSLAEALYKQMEKLVVAAYDGKHRDGETGINPLNPVALDNEPIPLKSPSDPGTIDRPTESMPVPERTNRPVVRIEPPDTAVPTDRPTPTKPVELTQPKRWDPLIPLPDEEKAANQPLFNSTQVRRAISGDSILNRFGHLIDDAAQETKLDSALIYSVVKAESNGKPDAVSHAGAKGLMQLIDSTAADYGVKQVFDPQENIRGGSRYLRDLVDRFGDLKLALAAYNAGPGNVEKYGGVPPFKETQDYVRRVMDHYTDALNAKAAGSAKVRR